MPKAMRKIAKAGIVPVAGSGETIDKEHKIITIDKAISDNRFSYKNVSLGLVNFSKNRRTFNITDTVLSSVLVPSFVCKNRSGNQGYGLFNKSCTVRKSKNTEKKAE